MARKQTRLIDSSKFIDNMVNTGIAISLCKRYERLLQRLSNGDGDLHDIALHTEWQSCRRHLAQLVGASQRTDLITPPEQRSNGDATWHEPSLPLEPSAPDAHLESDYEDRYSFD